MRRTLVVLAAASVMLPVSALGSDAHGALYNFDAVNNTGSECYGFEIEITDLHSRDITYTYDWNRYGTPQITGDSSDPLHPKVFIVYAAQKNSDGTWSAYTAIPSGPIAPTDGHRFTDPSQNFGGEHFGVGFYGTPSAVKYHWLIDDGAGNLIRGGQVYIGTPAFAYFPPVDEMPAQVQAAIDLPPPAEPPSLQFGEPMWLKVIATETHNNRFVELRDLVTGDPNDPADENWTNGEPERVEVEWQLMQTDFNSADGGPNGQQIGEFEYLPNGDEIITRRYEFFRYAGPIDEATGEAKANSVGPDDLHGEGIAIIDGVEVDLSTIVVVGDYAGAQMAGFDAAGQIGLIDHLQDGVLDAPYVERTVVIGGAAPIVTTISGLLPWGITFDDSTGVLSGTPAEAGLFAFTVHSVDAAGGDVTKTYELNVIDPYIVPPPHAAVSTMSSPVEGGVTTGDGDYASGSLVTIEAFANEGYEFVNWTEDGVEVSVLSSYEFVINGNRDLVANFVAPALQVISPDGGEIFYKRTTQAITWSSVGAVGSNVKLTLRLGKRSLVLEASTPNDGAFDWVIPPRIPNNAGYYLMIESTTDAAIRDQSDSAFSIKSGVPR